MSLRNGQRLAINLIVATQYVFDHIN